MGKVEKERLAKIGKEKSGEEANDENSVSKVAGLQAKKYQEESSGEGDSRLLEHFSRSTPNARSVGRYSRLLEYFSRISASNRTKTGMRRQ